ncbi:MAG: FAD-dependent oxidoreductase [Sphaerochaetaceae bacterium]|nr:FAD-dependent oxidoreductase [Sphaerochaetaceae bacterium]
MKDLSFDVVIIGGGPAGTMAAIAAGRHKLSTLLIEQGSCLGGMLTTAGVGPQMSFHAGDTKVVQGIADELVSRMVKRGFSTGHIKDEIGYASSITPFDAEGLKIVLEQMVQDAGVQILYHTTFIDCETTDGRITSVRLFAKNGFFQVKAKVFIDASADADLSTRAGIQTVYGDEKTGEAQPMTMNVKVYGVDRQKLKAYMAEHRDDMLETTKFDSLEIIPRVAFQGAESKINLAKANGDFHVERSRVLCFETNNPGEFIINMSHVHDLDATDPFDLTKAEIQGRQEAFEIVAFLRKYIPGFEHCIMHSTGQSIGIRESRKIVGKYMLTAEDLVTNTMFPDAIAMGGYPIDVHKKGDFWEEEKTYSLKPGTWYSIPYRCLVTDSIKNLIVAGRCISMNHMACGAVRVTPIVMAMGQAAGTAAYVSLTTGNDANNLDTDLLRKILVEDGAFLQEC